MRSTMTISSALAGLITATLAFGSTALASENIREINRSFPLDGKSSVRLDLPVAELAISDGSADAVEIEFIATCKREHDCREILDAIDFERSGSGRTLRLDLVGYPKWGKGRVELEGVVRVPKAMAIEVELGVGEIEMKRLSGNLRVELGVGEINAWIERETTHSVTLDAGVGEVELYGADERIEGRRSMLVGSEVHWDDGPGEARVFLEVGVGEISVWME